MSVSQLAERSAAYELQTTMESVLGTAFDLLATAPQGVAKLRELILSLAVQGKLVNQHNDDCPAADLVEQLLIEKASLIMEGKIRRDRATDSDDLDSLDYELPRGWVAARLADLAWPQAGFAFKSSAFNDIGEGLPLIRIRDVGVSDPTTFFAGEYREEFLVRVGDWLISMDGNFRVAPWRGPESLLNQRVTRLIFFGTAVPPLYICLALQLELRKLQGTKAYTTVDHLSGAQIASRVIPLPPLAEQTRIVARVEELMQLCDALEAHGRLQDEQHARLVATLFDALATCESAHVLAENWQRIAAHFDLLLDRPEAVDTLEQTILQLAVRGLLVPQDPADEPASHLLLRLGEERSRLFATGEIKRDKKLPGIEDEAKPRTLPVGWSLARLGSLANFIDYRGRTPVKTSEGVPLITAKNVRMGHIDRQPQEFIAADQYSSWMTRGIPRIGDILFTTEAPLGNVAAIDIPGRFALAQRVICFGMFEPRMSEFLKYLLMSAGMQAEFAHQATGVTAQGIKSARLQLIPVPVPPLAEQHRIVARVKELRGLCSGLRERLKQAGTTQSHLADSLVSAAAQSPAC